MKELYKDQRASAYTRTDDRSVAESERAACELVCDVGDDGRIVASVVADEAAIRAAEQPRQIFFVCNALNVGTDDAASLLEDLKAG